MLESWDDKALNAIAKSAAMKTGVPQIRQVLTPPDTAIKDLSDYTKDFIDALTRPLTDLEKASGTYQAPIPPRIAMTGTYDEIMAYFEGDQVSPSKLAGGPWCWMTDGSSITPPTEEAVAAMLKGTTHKPTEEIRMGADIAEDRIASVEKVAINAVMAGCKPEYMPVVLAIAEAGAATGYTGDGCWGHLFVTSGPIGQEIGLNYGFAFLAPGNKASTSIQRAAVLMGINLAGLKMSVNNGQRMSNPAFGETFSESPLTPWATLNVQNGYNSDNSILLTFGGGRGAMLPGVTNHGTDTSLARTGLEGYQLGSPRQLVQAYTYYDTSGIGGSLYFTPDAAKSYIDLYGFQTEDQLKKYIYDNALVSVDWALRQYYSAGRIPAFPQADANGMIRKWDIRANKDYKNLQIVVAGGPGPAWGLGPSLRKIISIDKWR